MGCGRVGASLADGLARIGHEVAVIDRDKTAFHRLSPEFPGERVLGMGFDRDVLERAGIEEAGAFAAVSSGDNSNIISARVARETFGVQRVVARIYDAKRAAVYERLGIPTVATVPWTTDRLLSLLTRESETAKWRERFVSAIATGAAVPEAPRAVAKTLPPEGADGATTAPREPLPQAIFTPAPAYVPPPSARPPVDGITPSTTPRVGDLATNGRSRARWSGEVLAVLALALAWGGPAVGAATRRRRASARVTAPQRPALGRAPPAFG